MPRTSEQIEADDALSAAIDRVVAAYRLDLDGGINGDYVVVVEQQLMDGEGELSYSSCTFFKNNRVSSLRAVGMLEMASFDLKMGRSDA